MNEKRYAAVTEYVKKRPVLERLVRICYYLLPYFVGVIYAGMIIFLIVEEFINKNEFKQLLFVVTGPLFAFVITSVFRKLYNAKRPYEMYGFTPLIKKHKSGESFPSRHAMSAAAIAAACFAVNLPLAVTLCIITILIAAARVVSGVHFIRDVLAGIIFGVGIVGVIRIIFNLF